MKLDIRKYTWIEFIVWLIILSLCIIGFRIHRYQKAHEFPSYQVFMPDVDGMIVGSPVKYMGVQVGYVKTIKIINDNLYVRFIITQKDLKLPKGVIATVEFSGLGGSKSLELYPPDQNTKTERIIMVNKPKRLYDALGLLYDMFSKIDAIAVRCSHFAGKLGVVDFSTGSLQYSPEEIGTQIRQADTFAEQLIKSREEFINKLKGWKYEERENNK